MLPSESYPLAGEGGVRLMPSARVDGYCATGADGCTCEGGNSAGEVGIGTWVSNACESCRRCSLLTMDEGANEFG